MAKRTSVSVESYPRITNGKYQGFLDESLVTPHSNAIDEDTLKKIILNSIQSANQKSSRKILDLDEDISIDEANKKYIKAGEQLFDYFLKYCGDPASTAFDCLGQHYSKIAKEQYHNKTL